MKFLRCVARVIFFPIIWMHDVRQELKLLRLLMKRKVLLDLRRDAGWGRNEQAAEILLSTSVRKSFWKELFE